MAKLELCDPQLNDSELGYHLVAEKKVMLVMAGSYPADVMQGIQHNPQGVLKLYQFISTLWVIMNLYHQTNLLFLVHQIPNNHIYQFFGLYDQANIKEWGYHREHKDNIMYTDVFLVRHNPSNLSLVVGFNQSNLHQHFWGAGSC